MAHNTFNSKVSVTYIGTATAILTIDGVNFLTDPFFSPANTTFVKPHITLTNTIAPAITLADLPPIDAVLLSHEDHQDNLDDLGRQLLDGRKVLTTVDGARKLSPRPGVKGLQPWEVVKLVAGGKDFEVTATPCDHLPGGECTGFLLTSSTFGSTDGLPNAIYFSGDTIYTPELGALGSKYHIVLALLNIGRAEVRLPTGPLQITMDGQQAARWIKEAEPELVIPLHFEGWIHFTEDTEVLERVFEEEGLVDKVIWLEAGKEKKIL